MVDKVKRFTLLRLTVTVTAPSHWQDAETTRWLETKGETFRDRLDLTAEEFREEGLEIKVTD
jgi:hypothetical protein